MKTLIPLFKANSYVGYMTGVSFAEEAHAPP